MVDTWPWESEMVGWKAFWWHANSPGHQAINCSKSPFIIGVGGCNKKFQLNHYNYFSIYGARLWNAHTYETWDNYCNWTTEYHCIESEVFTTPLFCQCLDNLYLQPHSWWAWYIPGCIPPIETCLIPSYNMKNILDIVHVYSQILKSSSAYNLLWNYCVMIRPSTDLSSCCVISGGLWMH